VKSLLGLLLFASSFLFAQARFDGTWEMKMDTIQLSSPPEQYLIHKGACSSA
jgi:hypothetical protein